MKQQQGAYPVQRASRQQPAVRRQHQPPANPHYAGRSAGIHPEDQPFLSDDLEEDDSYYETRVPTSARRYVEPQPQIIQHGNKRLVIHNEPPPRQYHWLTYVGLTAIVMMIIWLLVVIGGAWWQGKQDDWTYGHPRTFQTDQNVGHGNSQIPTSHFIALNLQGIIQVIEEPANDVSKAKIFNITTLQSGDGSVPVTLSFHDLNGDGKIDLVITIGDAGQQVSMFLFNTGTTFESKV